MVEVLHSDGIALTVVQFHRHDLIFRHRIEANGGQEVTYTSLRGILCLETKTLPVVGVAWVLQVAQ